MRSWVQRITASRAIVYSLFSALYLLQTIDIAQRKLFWEDEFFTLYLSRIPTWHGLLQALATGADQHPPSFYFLTHGLMSIFGTSPLTVRLPALVGFWLLCVCLYEIVRFLTNPLWGVVGMLFPLATNFSYYATEARGYGMVAGMAALALLCWLKAAENQKRAIFLPLLGASLASAVAMHYYAVIVMLCLATGEAVRTRRRGRVDLPMWIALACAFVPVIAFLQTIQKAKGYSTHFWAVPVWSDALNFYRLEVGGALIAVLGLVGLAMCFQKTLRSRLKYSSSSAGLRMPLNQWQAVAVCMLAGIPCLVMVGAKFVTHGFADRYAISAIVGITVLLCCLLFRVAPEPKMPLAAIIACLIVSWSQVREMHASVTELRQQTATTMRRLARAGDGPIVLTQATMFYRLSFYSERPFATRLSYIADADLAVQHLGMDTLDRGLLDLRPWFPLKTVTMEQFARANGDFLAYGETNRWGWLTYELPRLGEPTLLARDNLALLFAVKARNKAPLGDAAVLGKNMLYNKVPSTGPALCELYMGKSHCLPDK